MKTRTKLKQLTYWMIAIWLLVNGMGIHEHFCFDGSEPPFSVKIDVMENHFQDMVEHGFVDVESEQSKSSLGKQQLVDLPLLISIVLIALFFVTTRKNYYPLYLPIFIRRIVGVRPRLRAPPFYPV